jgi:alpha-L-rhamnosidase
MGASSAKYIWYDRTGEGRNLYGQSTDSTGKFRAVYPDTGDYSIADFALNMVEGYRNYYENSGDLDSISRD